MEKEAYLHKYFQYVTGPGIFLEACNELSDEGRPFRGISIGNIIYEDKK
jgi:hypothetical protein